MFLGIDLDWTRAKIA